jgi:uncharacterized iron-regulated membrane protein
MKLRSVLFWIHLVAGTVAGIVILVMSVTGTLLTFQQSVLQIIERSQRFVAVPSGADRLGVDVLLERVRAASPGAQPTTLTLTSDPAASAMVALGTQGTMFVNPYTGEILGVGSVRARGFYRSVTNWHRWLAVEGEHRATARAITGACNAAFLVLAVTGAYLWWPRQWTAKHVFAVTLFRPGLRGKARDFNWHNVIGFWSSPVLIVLTLTGMVISYPWASNLVYTLTGSPRPVAAGRGGGPAGSAAEGQRGRGGAGAAPRGAERQSGDRREPATAAAANQDHGARTHQAEPAGAVTVASLESLVARAEQRLPTWRTMIVRLPARPGGPVSFSMSDREHWNSFARSTLALNGASGAESSWEPYAQASSGQKLRGWMRFAHTGELGGRLGELVAGLASAGGAFLVWTGISLALRRFAAWSARRRSPGTVKKAA